MSQEMGERVFTTFPEIPAALNGSVMGIGDDQLPPSLNHLDSECFPWINRRSKINRLEVQAALNMSVNVLPFWLCTFPISCYAMRLYWCIRLESDCTFILITWPYTCGILRSIHSKNGTRQMRFRDGVFPVFRLLLLSLYGSHSF